MTVRLRPLRADDLGSLRMNSPEEDPFGFFGFAAENSLERAYAEDGLLTDDHGLLGIEDEQGRLTGYVGWFAVQHGPTRAARALNVGIALLPDHRGRGVGTAAQAALAAYLFRTTLIERLEAGTDVENLAEQRALEKAGFQREGIARHAQFRDGSWHDLVLYSRLRDDPAPA